MRKRVCTSEPATWTKSFFIIYSLGLYKLEPKRIDKFCAMLSQSGHQDAFLKNLRFCRQPPGDRQLAQLPPVLLYKHLAKNELKMLYESFWEIA